MDVLAQWDVIVPEFQRIAGKVDPADVGRPTPCSEWAVRDLLDHLIAGATTFAAVVRGEEPPVVGETPDNAKLAAATSALADIDGAFRSPGALERVVATPFGEMPGETFARLLAFDVLMHTWDLASSTGQQVEVTDAVVTEVDGFARAAVTPELRGPNTFGPETPAKDGASTLERLVAFSGRTP